MSDQGVIIYCSDLIFRPDNPNEDIENITEWLHSSTEFRPVYPEGCVLKYEVRFGLKYQKSPC